MLFNMNILHVNFENNIVLFLENCDYVCVSSYLKLFIIEQLTSEKQMPSGGTRNEFQPDKNILK